MLKPARKPAAMAQIGKGEHPVYAEPDLIPIQHAAVRHDTVGFMQMREDDVKFTAAFCLLNGAIQQTGATRDLGQLPPGFFTGILHDLKIDAFRNGVVAHLP